MARRLDENGLLNDLKQNPDLLKELIETIDKASDYLGEKWLDVSAESQKDILKKIKEASVARLREHQQLNEQILRDEDAREAVIQARKEKNVERLNRLRMEAIEELHEIQDKQLQQWTSEISNFSEELADKLEQLEVAKNNGSKQMQQQLSGEIDHLKMEIKIRQLQKEGKKNAEKRINQVKEEGFLPNLNKFIEQGIMFMADPALSFEAMILEAAQNIGKTFEKSIEKLGQNLNAGINKGMDNYIAMRTDINTRLQGTVFDQGGPFSTSFTNVTNRLSDIAFSPLISAEALYNNMKTLVDEGVVTNVAQRAFFMTIKDSIATTFDANNTALRKLIKIQQEDSTAARLGMEGYLTRFLNEFVENTEYLTTTFDNVADSLYQASALLSSREATEFEYIVQKWLGTLTGVGVSDQTAQAIANAIGQLGSGNVEGLNGGVGNLIVMAAARSGLSYGDLLNQGIDAIDTNDLLLGITNYLRELGKYSSNIVKSQIANTFGVTIQDLKAVANLEAENVESLYKSMMTTQDMYTELSSQMQQVLYRQGVVNMAKNAFDNFAYQTGMTIASNPITYATWKITDFIQANTEGINVPSVFAMGNGFDLNTTIENLIKLGLIGASTIANIGGIAAGVSSVFDSGWLLDKMGVNNENFIQATRGSGLNDYTLGGDNIRRRLSGFTTSEATYVGNRDSTDYTNSIVENSSQDAREQVKTQAEEQREEDPVYKYLKEEVSLDTTLADIARDINIVATDGVNVKNMSTNDLITGIAGFFTAPIGG